MKTRSPDISGTGSVSGQVAGFVAGTVATLPMTAVMILLHRGLKWHEQYPLPPRTITFRILGRIKRHTFVSGGDGDSTRLKILTLVSHFAFGGTCGALYSLSDRVVRAPRVVTGPLFGFLVWAGGYLAWLPALGILSPATEHPPRRTALMIAAHLAWGVSVGLLLDRYLSPSTSTPGDIVDKRS